MAQTTIVHTITVNNRYGLHARPAALFVELCNRYASEVLVVKDDVSVSGKNILDIMTLGAESGCTLELRITGADAEAASAALLELVRNNFGE